MSWFSFHKKTDQYPDFVREYLALDFRPNKNLTLEKLDFVVFDTETTGLEKSDKIITLGAVAVSHFSITIKQTLDLHFGLSSGSSSSEIHGEITSKPTGDLDAQIERILNFFSNKILVGHQVGFDVSKINQLLAARWPGLNLKNKVLDTFDQMIRLDREKYDRQVGGKNGLQLDSLCGEFGIEVENRHTALGDAFLTAQVLLHILSRLQNRGVLTMRDLM